MSRENNWLTCIIAYSAVVKNNVYEYILITRNNFEIRLSDRIRIPSQQYDLNYIKI